jgi:hypothetical protein
VYISPVLDIYDRTIQIVQDAVYLLLHLLAEPGFLLLLCLSSAWPNKKQTLAYRCGFIAFGPAHVVAKAHFFRTDFDAAFN